MRKRKAGGVLFDRQQAEGSVVLVGRWAKRGEWWRGARGEWWRGRVVESVTSRI